MFWMNFTSNSIFAYFAVFVRHIHRYIRVLFIWYNFRSLALLTDDHVTLFLVFSDKMAENGEVNTDHEGQKNG